MEVLVLVAGIVVAVIGVVLIFLSGEARPEVARALRVLGWVVMGVGVVLILVWLVRELGVDDESTAMVLPLPLPLLRLLTRRRWRGRIDSPKIHAEALSPAQVIVLYVDGRQVAQHVTDRPR